MTKVFSNRQFLQDYSDWLKAGQPDQVGIEHLQGLIDWAKSESIADVRPGYGYGCEIVFDAMGYTPTIAFDAKSGMLSVFPWSDTHSPSFIKVSGKPAQMPVQALNALVKDHLGLV